MTEEAVLAGPLWRLNLHLQPPHDPIDTRKRELFWLFPGGGLSYDAAWLTLMTHGLPTGLQGLQRQHKMSTLVQGSVAWGPKLADKGCVT